MVQVNNHKCYCTIDGDCYDLKSEQTGVRLLSGVFVLLATCSKLCLQESSYNLSSFDMIPRTCASGL